MLWKCSSLVHQLIHYFCQIIARAQDSLLLKRWAIESAMIAENTASCRLYSAGVLSPGFKRATRIHLKRGSQNCAPFSSGVNLKVNHDLCRGNHHSNRFWLALKLCNMATRLNEGATCMSKSLPIVYETEASGALQSSTAETVMAWCCLHG